jgi:hypothetical protein
MNSSNIKPTFLQTQNSYASLIKSLGETKLPDGKTLSESLTFDGICFWEIFSTEIAYRHLTTAMASIGIFASVKQYLRPYIHRLKIWVNYLGCRRTSKDCSNWSTESNIICLGFTGRMYREVLEPVVERLTMQSGCNVVILNDTFSSDTDKYFDGKCSFHCTYTNWNANIEEDIRHLRHSLSIAEQHLKSSNALKGLLLDLEDSLAVALTQIFHLLFKGYFPQMVTQVALAKHILKKHRPSIVISPDTSDSRARIYALLCRQMCIPYLDVQFGLTGDEAIEWRFFVANGVAVWGDSSKKSLIKQGVSEDQIHVTGSPRHDSLVNKPTAVNNSSMAKFYKEKNKKIVLLASTYTDSAHGEYTDPRILREMKLALFKAAENCPGLLLIVKPHPHENVNETRSLSKKYNNVMFVEQTSDIREVITICDAFVSFGSTATIDALIADKLTICPIFPGWPFSEVFRNSGAVLVTQSAEELIELFKKIEAGDVLHERASLSHARKEYLKDVVYQSDGFAAARIEQLVLKIIKD